MDGEGRREVPGVAWPVLAVVAVPLAVVLVALGGRYGFHRDELYFLACGRHPAWGYPDQPPLTPWVAHLMDLLRPGSVRVLHLPATASAVVVTLLAGLTARELGGGRFAQGLAAFAVGTGTFVLLSGHLLATSTLDVLLQVTLVWLVVHVLRTGRERLWPVAGLVLGVGLLNKQLPAFLAAALLIGMIATPSARRHLRSPWLWAGAGLAAACWLPVLLWQARNGWPQLTLAAGIRAEYGTPGERLGAAALQLVLFSLGATVLWITGLVRLWRDPAAGPFRVLAWTWPALLAMFAVTAGQGYYPAAVYPALIAAGAVAVERHRRRRVAVTAAVAVSAALLLPAALPLLTPARLDRSPWAGLGETELETVGWPALVDQVAAAYRSLPPPDRARAAVYATNYGEAGAVDQLGPARGLPHAYSGHNGYAAWGPPPETAAPVVVVWEGGGIDRFFTRCRSQGRVRTGVSNEEGDEASVHLCAAPRGGWREVWPRLSHLSS